MRENIRLGDILYGQGHITREQLDQTLAYQKEHREKRVGQILQELGFVTEEQVVEALAVRLSLEIVDLDKLRADLRAVSAIPRDMAEKQRLLGVAFEGQNLVVVTDDPLNYFALEEVRQLTGRDLTIRLALSSPLRRAIAYYYAETEAQKTASEVNQDFAHLVAEILKLEESESGDQEAPVIKLLNSLIERAISANASDIHIEPFETQTDVRMRVDGAIVRYVALQRSVHQPLIARIKIMAGLDIAERRLPQDGHFRVRLREKSGGEQFINLRVSLLPTVYGEKAVLRLLTSNAQIDYSDHFGMDEESYHRFLPILNSPNGIVYFTGPTGSGKSTTLYMVLEYLSGRNVNICTVEDPVEKNVPHINQTQVNPAAGLTFDSGLRALLRQDPDIIMVGETRDGETAGISVRAAITGHMVLSTLHTNDAISSIVRLADMGVDRYLIANSLAGLVAQRLVRKVCPFCGREVSATGEERAFLGKDVKTVRRGAGCVQCSGTGFRGRVAVHEIAAVDQEMRRMISRGAEMEELESHARERQGMRTLKEKGVELVERGVTTPEELLRIT